ncbi:MAG: hypothetical protein HYT80_03290 [Euryarchaeota archaeon]|nr:hypothetical protein [Euryarchaeota archaeon]
MGDVFAVLGLWILVVLVVAAAEASRPFLANPQKENALAFVIYVLALGGSTVVVALVVAGINMELDSPLSAPPVVGVWAAGAAILRRRGRTAERRWFHVANVAAVIVFLARERLAFSAFVADAVPAFVVVSIALAIPLARTLYPESPPVWALPPAAPGGSLGESRAFGEKEGVGKEPGDPR